MNDSHTKLEENLLDLQKLSKQYYDLDNNKIEKTFNKEIVWGLVATTVFIWPLGILGWLFFIIRSIVVGIKEKKNVTKPKQALKEKFCKKCNSFNNAYNNICKKIKNMPFFTEICDSIISHITTHQKSTEVLKNKKQVIHTKEREFEFTTYNISLSYKGYSSFNGKDFPKVIVFKEKDMEDLPDNIYLHAFTKTVIDEVEIKAQNTLSKEEFPNFKFKAYIHDYEELNLNINNNFLKFNINHIIEKCYYTVDFSLTYDGDFNKEVPQYTSW